jgi:hypothetical protein
MFFFFSNGLGLGAFVLVSVLLVLLYAPSMCNDDCNRIPYRVCLEAFSQGGVA